MKNIEKIFQKNGLVIKRTSDACPEQYDVFRNGEQVAYFRLRHGIFRVDYPGWGGETIYKACPNGDGFFTNDERLNYMTEAMHQLILKLNSTQ